MIQMIIIFRSIEHLITRDDKPITPSIFITDNCSAIDFKSRVNQTIILTEPSKLQITLSDDCWQTMILTKKVYKFLVLFADRGD